MPPTPYRSSSLEVAPQSLVLTRNDGSPHHSNFTLTNNSIQPILYSIRKPDDSSRFIDVSPSCGIISSTACDQIVLKIDVESLQNTGLDLTLGRCLVIEGWHVPEDLQTDTASMLSEIKSRGDEAPVAGFLEFRITFTDLDPTNPTRIETETGPVAPQNHAPIVFYDELSDEPNEAPTLIASSRHTLGHSEAWVANNPLPIDSPHNTITTEPSRLRNLPISVNDIAVEGSNPIDVTGNFSDLFVGTYRNTVRVALKRLRIGRYPSQSDIQDIKRFEREAAIWTHLDHPHILRFIGIYRADGYIYLTSPFMENGNLAHYIETNPDTDRASFVLETADALTYLHSMKIVHGDIKARNILVSTSRHALLCDFGLAKWAHSKTASASKGMGTARWQSPELLQGQSRRFESDTYAFGITIAEVLSGKIPFAQFQSWTEAAIIHAVLSGERPLLEPTHSPAGEPYERLWTVATGCWVEEPSSRPPMADVLAFLRSPSANPDTFPSRLELVLAETKSQSIESSRPASPPPAYTPAHSIPDHETPPDTDDVPRMPDIDVNFGYLADLRNRWMSRDPKRGLDTCLLLAGFLSATNTAFIAHTLPSATDTATPPFVDSNTMMAKPLIVQLFPSLNLFAAFRLFYASLFCSILTAVGAMLVSWWLRRLEMEQIGPIEEQTSRRAVRQQLEEIALFISGLLLLSIVLFFLGVSARFLNFGLTNGCKLCGT